MNPIIPYIQERLFALQDTVYQKFNAKLIPNVDASTIIGVRTPALRALAKELVHHPDIEQFLDTLPHTYYEENNLHGFLIALDKNYERVITRLEAFFPYIDNWATCDLLSPKIFAKYSQELIVKITQWIVDPHPYTIRFAIEMLMSFYLDKQFDARYLSMVANIRSEEYYVNMMIAWYFATALAKQYENTVPYLETCQLSVWTHNKSIQKAIESYRISEEQKAYLRSLKQK